jgi:hypothetical protein
MKSIAIIPTVLSCVFILVCAVLFADIDASSKTAEKYNASSVQVPTSVSQEVFLDAIVMAKGASYAKGIAVAGVFHAMVSIGFCIYRWRRR